MRRRWRWTTRPRPRLQTLREAVQSRNKLQHGLSRRSGVARASVSVRPLGCFYWGKVWTFSAWCELREDFRGFRVDRIDQIEVLPERFRDEPGKTLAEMLRRLQADRPAAAIAMTPDALRLERASACLRSRRRWPDSRTW